MNADSRLDSYCPIRRKPKDLTDPSVLGSRFATETGRGHRGTLEELAHQGRKGPDTPDFSKRHRRADHCSSAIFLAPLY
jgi:hypothetical protein